MNTHAYFREEQAQILIVEDSPTQSAMLKFQLEQNGYRVTQASNGQQALDYLFVHNPALVISDIIMPGLNGYELCKHIKDDEHTKDILVILLTGLSNTEDILIGLIHGADSFISKPYSEEHLLDVVERILATTDSGDKHERVELEFQLAGKIETIIADPQRVLDMFISSYTTSISRYSELLKVKEELRSLNAHLEDLVETRTEELIKEIAERKHLQEELLLLSTTDALTGINNRRGFMTLAEQYWLLAKRSSVDFALLFMDLDGLKGINDTFSHTQGDEAIQATAKLMERTFRDSDILGRMGGDEFIALLPECNRGLATAAVTRLKNNLEEYNDSASHPFNLALSIGLVLFEPNNPLSLADLIKQADQDMYTHKQRSR